jgi:MFS transporter, OFA family, oxalate/formate antiporter
VRNISALSNPRIFYSWFVFYGGFVVTAAFAITFVGFGSAYALSAFVASLQQDFGASRGSVSLVFSLTGFLYFGLGIVTGPLADGRAPAVWPSSACSSPESAWRLRARRAA